MRAGDRAYACGRGIRNGKKDACLLSGGRGVIGKMRCGKAAPARRVSDWKRPIDLHLKGFHLMGAKSRQAHGMVELQAEGTQGQ